MFSSPAGAVRPGRLFLGAATNDKAPGTLSVPGASSV